MRSKRRKQYTPSEVFTDAKKRKIMDGMLNGRVPAGLNDSAVERVKTGCNDTATFKKCNLTTIVDTTARKSLYSDSVKSVFGPFWDATILQYDPQGNMTDTDGDPGSSTVTMGAGMVEEADDSMGEFPHMDEEKLGTLTEADAEAWEQKRSKTVTVRLQDIVREELLKGEIDSEPMSESSKNLDEKSTDYEKVVKILIRIQDVLTNAVDELTCLGRKTILLVRYFVCAIASSMNVCVEYGVR